MGPEAENLIYCQSTGYPMQNPQQRIPQHSQVSPNPAREAPSPAIHRNHLSGRSDYCLHLPYHGICGALFLCHIRAVSLDEQTVAFPADDTMQQVLFLVLEQHHIHRAQLLGRTRVQHDFILPITDQGKHGNSLQAELYRTAIRNLALHPSEEQIIRYLLHGRIRYDRTTELLPHRASKPNDRTEQRSAIG